VCCRASQRGANMKGAFVLFTLAASLSVAQAQKDILDELRFLGYDLVDNTIDPSAWEKRTFGTMTIRSIRMKSKNEVPSWLHAHYRFVLEVDQFAHSADAAARLKGIRMEPPGLSAEMRKVFPLRDGFQLGTQVYILSTDVASFYDDQSRLILNCLHRYLATQDDD
jgi:hypothetical protein